VGEVALALVALFSRSAPTTRDHRPAATPRVLGRERQTPSSARPAAHRPAQRRRADSIIAALTGTSCDQEIQDIICAELTEVDRIASASKTRVARVRRDDRPGWRGAVCTFDLTAPAGWRSRGSAASDGRLPSGPHGPDDGRPGAIRPKIIARPRIARPEPSRVAPKPGCRVASVERSGSPWRSTRHPSAPPSGPPPN
jgi:hypothetical protein